jgi:PTH1 family peptidyl-tRNA hydrolase
MMLIVGLGNPGKKFERTRHNVGFRIADEFSRKNNFPEFKLAKKFLAEISEGFLGDKKIILAKPQTFMNTSGQAVKKLIKNYKLKLDDLIFVHDDIDLPLGKIKISAGRSSAGHKGVESIIRELKTKNFIRFRIGIKPQEKEKKTEKLVLEKFSKDEEKILKEVTEKTVEAIEATIKENAEKAMTKFN